MESKQTITLKISIIIPVLNEASTIGDLLTYLIENSGPFIQEILIVDGGSADETQKIVEDFIINSSSVENNIKLVNSPKGRAKQMNIGANEAKAEILYFLHADSYPPKNYDELIVHEFKKGFLAGCFRMKFDSNHPILKLSQWFTRFNFKSCRGGDQSLFITKCVFANLDGFDEKYIVYEDCEFINRIYSTTAFKVIPKTLITSARRYDLNGAWKLQYHFAIIHFKKWLGASAESLHKYYLKNIVS